ncbi:MAG: oligopeptide transporter, OPT family [Bdellovibrionales bacterium RIFOXYB1_FULL_37_110]|nr:MAG: oligopeptide transporter, OPT family [Bdellovibrionales bacterium RIFOXYC1_FULL_37_79]OFZ56912.1 MAG: oligopeptide transporter, OPT family [Bdellovibrionales bacterium RIFOXYB1_FULL_37_110]OFZ61999.1 MAG: oligopeptide transporter, OPT family [Bdellovibrionales bacterium RIFOXYD1_FULL_36_51]
MNNQGNKVLEFTISAVVIGVVIGVVMTAANVYLGLYAGMTVSASIPAAVIAMGIYKGLLKKNSILESNMVQTIASAGESLAAGIIFTLPALVLVGAWQNFEFWPTTLIAIAGGLLGVVFMIPLRRALIVEDKDLTYPEGVACATVLEAGSSEGKKGFITILFGLGIGGIFKLLTSGFKVVQGSVEKAFIGGDRVWFFGSDISPALLAVGYIVNLEVALLVFIGGSLGWFITMPILGLSGDLASKDALEVAWELWSKQIRYLGVGAMLTGGVWSIISVRKGIVKGVGELKNTYSRGKNQTVKRTEQDMNLLAILVMFIISFVIMLLVYQSMIHHIGLTIFTSVVMTILAFLFVAVSSYIVGLVGSSNNPVSGMTISALLVTASLFLVLGFTGNSAILATLGVAAIVCCAACTAGDCSQDLKTGYLVGATPKYQQIAEMIGVVIPAFVIAPVLSVLHSAYGIGTGLKAPQATLFASITNALFGDGNLPYRMVIIGAASGVLIIIFDQVILKKIGKFRLHLMPMAVGIYLPITLAVPMLMGGLIRYFVDRKNKSHNEAGNGVLLSSGLIAGEAIMGVVLAFIIYMNIDISGSFSNYGAKDLVSVGLLILVSAYLWMQARKKQ